MTNDVGDCLFSLAFVLYVRFDVVHIVSLVGVETVKKAMTSMVSWLFVLSECLLN